MENQEHIIKVDGHSAICVAPDELMLQIVSKSSYETNEEANKSVYNDIKQFNDILKQLGMRDVEPRICAMGVKRNPHLTDERNVVNTFDTELKIRLTTDIDSPCIEQLVLLIGKKMKDAEISFSYQLKDPTQHKLMALSNAVKDAELKAIAIAEACGYKLESIKQVEETRESGLTVTDLFSDVFCASSPKEQEKPKVKDIVVSADVSIEWNIVKAL